MCPPRRSFTTILLNTHALSFPRNNAITTPKALGLVSAGTNNSRVAQLLRQLSEFYAREASHLFVTRIAQGLNHMGKVRRPGWTDGETAFVYPRGSQPSSSAIEGKVSGCASCVSVKLCLAAAAAAVIFAAPLPPSGRAHVHLGIVSSNFELTCPPPSFLPPLSPVSAVLCQTRIVGPWFARGSCRCTRSTRTA